MLEGGIDMHIHSKAAVLVGQLHGEPIIFLIGGRLGVQRPAPRVMWRAPTIV